MASQSQYEEYNNTANKILNEILIAYSIKLTAIRWTDFVNLLKDKYDVSVMSYQKFKGTLAQIFAGSLLVTPEGSIIGYNAGSSQARGRRRFTIVHEGVHFMCDARKGTVPQSFSDLLKNKNYSDSELQEEDNANFVASLLMCNDSALIDSMKNGDDIGEFCNKFGFTHAAAWTRIYNYLVYSFNLPRQRASILAKAYVSGKDTERQSFLNVLIPNKDSFWNYMNIKIAFSVSDFNELSAEWHDKTTTSSHFYQFQNLVNDLYSNNGKICHKCKATYYGEKSFCTLCGAPLQPYTRISQEAFNMTTTPELNENAICTVCPHCGIQNVDESIICQYCGAFLQNICTGITPTKYKELVLDNPSTHLVKDDWICQFGQLDVYHNIIPGNLLIDHILIDAELEEWGNYPHKNLYTLKNYSRFCDQCGCLSSFYLQKLLPDVNLKPKDPFESTANPFTH